MGCCFSEPEVVCTSRAPYYAGPPQPVYPAAAPAYGYPPPAAPYGAQQQQFGYGYAQPQPYPPYPTQQVTVVRESSGMGTAGAAMLGAGAGMMGGMLLVDAMTPHYAYAQPTIIDNTTIINNDNTSVLVDGGYGGYDGGFDGGYAYDGGASSAYAW